MKYKRQIRGWCSWWVLSYIPMKRRLIRIFSISWTCLIMIILPVGECASRYQHLILVNNRVDYRLVFNACRVFNAITEYHNQVSSILHKNRLPIHYQFSSNTVLWNRCVSNLKTDTFRDLWRSLIEMVTNPFTAVIKVFIVLWYPTPISNNTIQLENKLKKMKLPIFEWDVVRKTSLDMVCFCAVNEKIKMFML